MLPSQPIGRERKMLVFLINVHFVFRTIQDQVQNYSSQATEGNAGVQDNLGPIREVVVEVRHRQGNHGNTNADSYEHQVVRAFEVNLGQRANPAGEDHAKHSKDGAA